MRRTRTSRTHRAAATAALPLVAALAFAPTAAALDLTETVKDTTDSLTGTVEDTSDDLGQTVDDTSDSLTRTVGGTTKTVEDTSSTLLPRSGTSTDTSPSTSSGSSSGSSGPSPSVESESGTSDTPTSFSVTAAGAQAGAEAGPAVRAAPDQTVSTQIQIGNPYDTDVRVTLRAADVLSVSAGIPRLSDVLDDAGGWITFDEPEVTLAPHSTRDVGLRVNVPEGAEPGEHPAAIVAALERDGADVEETVTQFNIEVTGSASPEFSVENVRIERDSKLLPGEATLVVELRNTGRVRLRPTVTVNGEAADGPGLLVPAGVERYQITRPLPFWGGPVRFRIEATSMIGDRTGPVQLVRASTFVTPWHLPALTVLVAGTWLLGRRTWRRRGRRAALEAEVQRLERLLAEQRAANERLLELAHVDQRLLAAAPAEALSAEIAIRSAIKQARRASDDRTEARLREALDRSLD